MPVLQTNHLHKKYGSLVAVDDLNFSVEEGEIFGLLGPNGAGKSSTLMMLTTLLKPTTGTAIVNGFDIVKQPAQVRGSIGIVFQDPSSDDTLTGYENLKLHGMLYHMPAALREKRIHEVLELVDLSDRKKDLVKKYSGGMRRRLEIARGLMHHPKILFLDEPTVGLDPQTREHIWHYISTLSKQEKISIILTTHYMEEAELLCQRIAIVDYGKIKALDTTDNLKKVVAGDVVNLEVAKPDLEVFRQLPFVKKAEASQAKVTLTVLDAKEHLQEILQTAGEVRSVEVHVPTLNDVFLHYTGRAIREAPAEGGWAERSMHYSTKK